LQWMKDQGFEDALKSYAASGGSVVGICGGYQRLTEQRIDEHGTDTGNAGTELNGLGLIPAKTTFHEVKTTIRVSGVHTETGSPIEGYEIHLG
ncbi:cobyric acid synthase CobQ, partial [Planococcus sp. SIMBA_143]